MNAVLLSVSVAVAATGLSLPFALATAWVLERTRWPGRGLVHGLALMPLVLPPVVTGYLLLAAFSPRGALGRTLEGIGLPVAFHWLGAVVAAAVVGFPLLVMQVGQALRSVDPRLERVSRSLGRSGWQTAWRVTLPLCRSGILAGVVLAFARGLGEFGATIVLAGSIPGETETIPLAVHGALAVPGAEGEVLGLSAASLVFGLAAVWGFRSLERRHRRRLEWDR